MKLEAYQKNILALVKGKPAHSSTPYFTNLATSSNLQLIKGIAVWWRAYQIEQYCPLSSSYLKRKKLFDKTIDDFYFRQNISSFIEEAGIQFLSFLSSSKFKNLHSLSAFEYAIIKIKKGDKNIFQVTWDTDPTLFLVELLNNHPIQETHSEIKFSMKIAHDIPGLFSVTPQKITFEERE